MKTSWVPSNLDCRGAMGHVPFQGSRSNLEAGSWKVFHRPRKAAFRSPRYLRFLSRPRSRGQLGSVHKEQTSHPSQVCAWAGCRNRDLDKSTSFTERCDQQQPTIAYNAIIGLPQSRHSVQPAHHDLAAGCRGNSRTLPLHRLST